MMDKNRGARGHLCFSLIFITYIRSLHLNFVVRQGL